MHESFEIGIAGRRRNRAVKGKIGLDRGVACRDGCIDGVKPPSHVRKVLIAALFGGDGRRFEFNGEPKLEYVLDLGQGANLIGNQCERSGSPDGPPRIRPSPDG